MGHVVLLLTMIIVGIPSKEKKKLLFGAFCILYIFSALRYQYGTDYVNYFNNYELIQKGKEVYGAQIIFELLNKIFSNFYLLIAVTSIFLLIAVYKLIVSNVEIDYAWISVVIFLINPYLFLMSLSAIRQTLATALFIWATQFSKKKQIIPYVILIFLASLIHSSAIILIPVYFIANERTVGWGQLAITGIVFLILLFGNELFNVILDGVLNIFSDTAYDSYVDNGYTNSLRATLLTSITLIYVVINIPHLKGSTLMYSKLYLIGLCFNVLAYKMSMLTRMQMYFDIFSIVSIPMIIRANIVEKSKKRPEFIQLLNIGLPILIFVVYVLRYYSFFTNPMWEAFYHYKTILVLWV